MTGIEVLAEEISQRTGQGYKATLQKVKSDTVRLVLEVLAENQGLLEKTVICEADEMRKEIKAELSEARKATMEANRRERAVQNRERSLECRYRELEKERKRLKEMELGLYSLKEKILQPETPEGRDRLRLLQIFSDSVNVVTNQNNTAYIAGCASILSGTPAWSKTAGTEKETPQTETKEASRPEGTDPSWIHKVPMQRI